MKRKNKILLLTLSSALLLSPLNSITNAEEQNFKDKYNEYIKTCSSDEILEDKAKVKECQKFNEYLETQNADLENKIKDLQSQSDDIQKNVQKYLDTINEYENEINELEAQVYEQNSVLSDISQPIEHQTEQLKQLSAAIDSFIKKSNDRINRILKFGGTDKLLNNFPQKENIINALSAFLKTTEELKKEQQIIDNYHNKIQAIDGNRENLGGELNIVKQVISSIEDKQRNIRILKEEVQKVIIEYKRQQAEIEKNKTAFIDDKESVLKSLKAVSKNLLGAISVDKLTLPIDHFTVTATPWNYPQSFGGGLHLGLDLAASEGSEIKSPFNGVVLFSSNSCPINKGYGDNCGNPGVGGGGNQIMILGIYKEKLCALSFFHLKHNTVISAGKEIKVGDYLGQVGTSGNSTGPHAHIEMYELNEYKNIDDFINNWDGDLSFGTGFGSTGYNKRCEVIGHNKNCRLMTSNEFGVTQGQVY